MCHVITMIAPAETDMDRLNVALKQFHRTVCVVENRHVKKHLKSGEAYFCAMPGYCDCGTALGSMRDDGMLAEERLLLHKKEVAKLKRKGWSDAKIRRWENDQAKADRRIQTYECPDGPDEWLGLIGSLLKDHGLLYVGILLHMYSRGFETSPKDIKRVAFDFGEDLSRRLY